MSLQDKSNLSWDIVLNNWGDEAHFCLNGYMSKQNCIILSEKYPHVYKEIPLHVWCAIHARGIIEPYFLENAQENSLNISKSSLSCNVKRLFLPSCYWKSTAGIIFPTRRLLSYLQWKRNHWVSARAVWWKTIFQTTVNDLGTRHVTSLCVYVKSKV